MSSAEQAVRARLLALLRADAELTALVHGVFDGAPPRANAPYVSIAGAEGSDWGTKDCAGREVRVMLILHGAGSALDDRAAAQLEAVVNGSRGAADGWIVVAVRVVRTRFASSREGGWRHELVVRCRCLAG